MSFNNIHVYFKCCSPSNTEILSRQKSQFDAGSGARIANSLR